MGHPVNYIKGLFKIWICCKESKMHEYSHPYPDSDTDTETGTDSKLEKGKSKTHKLYVTKYL